MSNHNTDPGKNQDSCPHPIPMGTECFEFEFCPEFGFCPRLNWFIIWINSPIFIFGVWNLKIDLGNLRGLSPQGKRSKPPRGLFPPRNTFGSNHLSPDDTNSKGFTSNHFSSNHFTSNYPRAEWAEPNRGTPPCVNQLTVCQVSASMCWHFDGEVVCCQDNDTRNIAHSC